MLSSFPRNQHLQNNHHTSLYQKALLCELGRQGKTWYQQPYYAEKAHYKRYDDLYWERKFVFAELIKKFQISIRTEDHNDLRNLIFSIFEGTTDPTLLSGIKRRFIFERIHKFRNNRERVYDVYEKYCESIDDGNLFVKATAPWMANRRICGNIEVVTGAFGIDLYCHQESDYIKIVGEGTVLGEKNSKDTRGMTRLLFKPNTISDFVRVYNGPKTMKLIDIYKHETQHIINNTFFQNIKSPYEKGQDEIIAFMKDGISKSKILQLLLDKTGSYNFFLANDNTPLKPKTYEKDHGRYFRDILKYVDIAFELKTKGVENYLNLLVVTPIHDWPKLKHHLLG